MGLLSNVTWMSKASCAGQDHKIFIAYDRDLVDQAKVICSSCPVKIPCAEQYFDVTCVAGGYSFYDRKIKIWKKVDDVNESNWRGHSVLLRELSSKT